MRATKIFISCLLVLSVSVPVSSYSSRTLSPLYCWNTSHQRIIYRQESTMLVTHFNRTMFISYSYYFLLLLELRLFQYPCSTMNCSLSNLVAHSFSKNMGTGSLKILTSFASVALELWLSTCAFFGLGILLKTLMSCLLSEDNECISTGAWRRERRIWNKDDQLLLK